MTAQNPVLLSIGSLNIDDIKFEDGTIEKDVLGGGGVHAIYGMRLWYPPPRSHRVGFHVQKGFDLPPLIYAQLRSLSLSFSEKLHPAAHTPRIWIVFGPHDHRDEAFQYPIIRTTPKDFPPDWVIAARVVHFICSPDRASAIVTEWDRLRRQYATEHGIMWETLHRTVHIWEPLPLSAIPGNWEACREVMREIDVLTPNHEEAAAFLGRSMDGFEDADDEAAERELDLLADAFLESGVGRDGKGCVVIRAGRRGCLVATREQRRKLPAYWHVSAAEREGGITKHMNVRDVTGAGNAFCGGFAVGLLESGCGDVIEAALYGTVSASFTVEQVGMPRLVAADGGIDRANGDEGWEEKWNDGPSPRVRLDELRKRLGTV